MYISSMFLFLDGFASFFSFKNRYDGSLIKMDNK
jgi:hypothetical protein